MAGYKQRPIRLGSAQKRDVATQFGALCYRVKNGKLQVLLVTSRGTGRWLVPKGWPIDGMTPAEAAAREAYEEAGVKGKPASACLGVYSYAKRLDGDRQPCVVALFPVRVRKLVKDFPEAGERKRKWFSPSKASRLVDEPELASILRQFDPSRLPAS